MVSITTRPFASHQSFLDPQLTSDGKPYGPVRYKQIVQERYIISKQAHISYSDTGKMTPSERKMILQFLVEDSRREKEALEKAKSGRKNHSKK